MNRRKEERIKVPPGQRKSVAFIGLILMLPGIAALFAGRLFYSDHRNLLVFAPFSLLLGVVMIVFAFHIPSKKD